MYKVYYQPKKIQERTYIVYMNKPQFYVIMDFQMRRICLQILQQEYTLLNFLYWLNNFFRKNCL